MANGILDTIETGLSLVSDIADIVSLFNGGTSNDSDAKARRVRLRPKPTAAMRVYGSNGLLTPLRSTNGLVWPYQPQITYEQTVEYSNMDLVHVNQDILAYNKTSLLKLTIQGQFTVQNQQEGLYALACIHFLRTVTKMNFGSSDPNAGTPPPVLLFDAYGQYMFNQLPVVVTQFSVELNNEVDYVPVDLSNVPTFSLPEFLAGLAGISLISLTPQINTYNRISNSAELNQKMFKNNLGNGKYVWLPSAFNLSASVTIQNTAQRLRAFNLNQFRTGQLMKQGRWV